MVRSAHILALAASVFFAACAPLSEPKPTASGTGTAGASGSVSGGAAGISAGAGSTGSSGDNGAAGSPVGSSGASGAPAGSGSAGSSPMTSGSAGSSPTATGAGGAAPKMGSLNFTRKDLHNLNLAEAVAIADYNHDGKPDLLSGPFWWEGPAFDTMHQLNAGSDIAPFCTPQTPQACNCYTCTSLGDWAEYPYDVDGDGWDDVIEVSRPSFASNWYKNPKMPALAASGNQNWEKHPIGTLIWEQSGFTEIGGKGVWGLVGASNGNFGWFEPSATGPWPFHVITGGAGNYAWEHGIGYGMDVTAGTGMNFINRNGWFTPPAAGPTSGPWTAHAQAFTNGAGGSHLHAYDVNGDGQTDVVTSLEAHGYGLAWFEQQKGTFIKHIIVGPAGTSTTNAGGIMSFSQPHVLTLEDVDGDGLKDIVTGKVFYAHPPGMDPGAADTPVFYVFKLIRGAQGAVTWEPHLIDSVRGLGKGGPVVVDLNGDGVMDIATASKHGVSILFQQPLQ